MKTIKLFVLLFILLFLGFIITVEAAVVETAGAETCGSYMRTAGNQQDVPTLPACSGGLMDSYLGCKTSPAFGWPGDFCRIDSAWEQLLSAHMPFVNSRRAAGYNSLP